MTTQILGVLAMPKEELAAASNQQVNSHTFIGLGLMFILLTVFWLIRRSRTGKAQSDK
jgi:hypothetical protein